MITWIEGIVHNIEAVQVEVKTGGLVYLVGIIPGSYSKLMPGDPLSIHIVYEWRDDGAHLYGFADRETRQAFIALRTVRGVGPKLALHVLACHDAGELAGIVSRKGSSDLQRVSGVGLKLAQRIVNELPDLGVAVKSVPVVAQTAQSEARLALASLGYHKQVIGGCFEKLEQDRQSADWDVQTWVKNGLQLMVVEPEQKQSTGKNRI